jgi:hypothetical protein
MFIVLVVYCGMRRARAEAMGPEKSKTSTPQAVIDGFLLNSTIEVTVARTNLKERTVLP